MSDIRIHRKHELGLARARKVAWQWAEEVEKRFEMACTVIEGEHSDTVEFTRVGVHGRLIVAADHFDLDARLGFLLGAFRGTIEREIENNLDQLLAKNARPSVKAATKAAAKKAPRK
jgi:putative polyhydroxyalkanoate system protein